jgi:hypothetical protein
VGVGVLSGPQCALSQLWARIRGNTLKVNGYAVNAKAAVDCLASHHPGAAAWWLENTPYLLDGKRNFAFDANACEPVV